MEKSTSQPATLSLTKSPGLNLKPSASLAGGIQSHLSTSNSQSRFRATVAHPPEGPPGPSHFSDSSSSLHSSWSRSSLAPHPPLYTLYASRIWEHCSKPWMKWIIFSYCLVSSLLFSIKMLGKLRPAEPILEDPPPQVLEITLSPLNNLSIPLRMSRMSSLSPTFKSFHPNVLQNDIEISSAGITACLWTSDLNPTLLSSWAAQWQGPISLLLTTSLPPQSHHPVLSKLTWVMNTSLISSPFSIHILHVIGEDQLDESPNAFLNLARLFARTPRVLLFPSNLSVPPPLSATSHHLHNRSQATVLVAARPSNSFPFHALSPVFLPRDCNLWCTERFFNTNSRAGNWEQFLWQLWLETTGGAHVVEVPGSSALANAESPIVVSSYVFLFCRKILCSQPASMLILENKIQNRLSIKYKTETCILASKRLASLEESDGLMNTAKAAWIKRFCRRNLGSWVKDVLGT